MEKGARSKGARGYCGREGGCSEKTARTHSICHLMAAGAQRRAGLGWPRCNSGMHHTDTKRSQLGPAASQITETT